MTMNTTLECTGLTLFAVLATVIVVTPMQGPKRPMHLTRTEFTWSFRDGILLPPAL
jgi:hypothetical protein